MVVVTNIETGREVDQGDLIPHENPRSFTILSWESETKVQYDKIYYTYRHEQRG